MLLFIISKLNYYVFKFYIRREMWGLLISVVTYNFLYSWEFLISLQNVSRYLPVNQFWFVWMLSSNSASELNVKETNWVNSYRSYRFSNTCYGAVSGWRENPWELLHSGLRIGRSHNYSGNIGNNDSIGRWWRNMDSFHRTSTSLPP